VGDLPTDGSTLYVRLWYLLSSGWQYADYTYTAASSGGAGGSCGTSASTPALLKPAPGSTLPGSTATFCWSAGSGVSQYWLDVGTSAAGPSNIYSQSAGTSTSVTVGDLPTDGSTLYVRLWYLLSSGWQYADYTYTAVSSGAGGTTYSLSLSANPASCASALSGTAAGSYAAGASISVMGNSCTGYSFTGWSVSGASCSGGASSNPCTFSMPSGNVSVTATYTAAGGGSCTGSSSGTPSMLQPTPGSTLPGSTVTFCWTLGSNVAEYWVWVGTTAGGHDISAGSQLSGTTSSTTVSNLPTDGSTVYVRLWYLFNGSNVSWQYTDYTYTAS